MMKILHFLPIYPLVSEIILVTGAVMILMTGLFRKRLNKSNIFLGILFLLFALINLDFSKATNIFTYNMFVNSNQFISLAQMLLLIGGIASLMLSSSYIRINPIYASSEYVALILFSIMGMMLMLSANNYLMLYISIEMQSLCLYLLACFERDNIKSSEAGLKYFILGSIASGLLLYGISLIYGFSGTINFIEFNNFYASYPADQPLPIALMIGMVMVVVGLAFKMAAAPFHMWVPDVYQGSSLPVVGFFATVPKLAIVLLFAKLVMLNFNLWVDSWVQIIGFLAIASMIVGALGALRQKDIKRLLAYSAIGHVGYMLIAVATRTNFALQSLVVYVSVYAVLNLGIIAALILLDNKKHQQYDLSIFAGLAKTNPVLAASLAMILLSLAGIPPFAGFVAKFYIFLAAIKAGVFYIPLFGLLLSIISAYYYLRIIKIMYFDKITVTIDIKHSNYECLLLLMIVVLFNLVLLLLPTAFNEVLGEYIHNLRSFND